MRRVRMGSGIGGLTLATVVLAGCHSVPARLLSAVGLLQDPLVVAVVMDNKPAAAAEAINPFPRWAGLQKALSDDLGRPIMVDVCFPFQVPAALDSGWYDLAAISPVMYAQWPSADLPPVLAVPVDGRGRGARGALLVVVADSPIKSVEDLRGRIVAFGPAGDARTHHAALHMIEAGGLRRGDLSLEALPVLGSLKHLPNDRSVFQTVLAGSSDAGFVDEAAWEALPEQPVEPGEPGREGLRVVGKTLAVPRRLMVGSPKLDAAVAEKVKAALLAMSGRHPEVLSALETVGYEEPDQESLDACRALRVGEPAMQMEPAEEPEQEMGDRPSSDIAPAAE